MAFPAKLNKDEEVSEGVPEIDDAMKNPFFYDCSSLREFNRGNNLSVLLS